MGDWVVCPHCGEKISRDAKSCRHCGSDDSTGWSEATYLDSADLPGEDDYDDSLEREGFAKPGLGRAVGPNRLAMAGISVLLILLFALWLLRSLI